MKEDYIVSVSYFSDKYELNVEHYAEDGRFTFRYEDAKHFENKEQTKHAVDEARKYAKKLGHRVNIVITTPEELTNRNIMFHRVALF